MREIRFNNETAFIIIFWRRKSEAIDMPAKQMPLLMDEDCRAKLIAELIGQRFENSPINEKNRILRGKISLEIILENYAVR